MAYITTIADCDNYLIYFLPIKEIIKLCLVNRSLNKLVTESVIYLEYVQLKNIYKPDILIDCYEKGLINVLQNFHRNGKNIFVRDGLNYASENGHVAILDWFKDSGLEFKYSNYAIDYASRNGHVAVLDWFKKLNK